MKINRRDFFKKTAAFGGSLALGYLGGDGRKAFAAEKNRVRPDCFAMLTDLTACVGCRSCERACVRANKMPMRKVGFYSDISVYKEKRRPDAQALTVVNAYENRKWANPVYRKVQCNHCIEPACASACLVGALKKTPEGPVIYDEDLCIGCRYCMTACPFYIPAFDYANATSPAIKKCTMCYPRIVNGMVPACAEACSVQAITFGKKSKLIKFARERIRTRPDRYIDHIYGENEVGGTDWLYISGVPFESLGFPMDLKSVPYPEFTREFLTAVPFVLVTWPALLGGFSIWARRGKDPVENQTSTKEKEVAKK
jgi:Fe-S-cluster-containing dehydrogenase component